MSAGLVPGVDRALDLFAGTGWGVACTILGIREVGVEKMPEARAVRAANGMSNWVDDVWDVLERTTEAALIRGFGRAALGGFDSPEFQAALLIASPPCQTFSMAGNGAGRRALDEVLGLIDSRAYLDVAKLRAFGEEHDPRTALVLTPLTYVAKHTPLYVVLEQVPTVLPVWERMAVEMRRWGYSVVTGVLNAEQYGVPQTRKRAILIARADGVEARMPTPTHSRYYPNDKTKLDPGVLPWVSMAEGLGWGLTSKPSHTLTAGTHGAPDPYLSGGQSVRASIEAEIGGPNWKMRSQYTTGHGERAGEPGERLESEPAATVTSKAYSNEWQPEDGAKYFRPTTYGRRGIHPSDEPAPTIRGTQRDMPETYEPHPSDAVVFQGHQKPDSKRSGDEPDAYQTREADRPAPTLSSGSRSAQWRGRVNDQSGTARDESWPEKRPATTLAARDLVADPGHNKSRHDAAHVTKSRNDGVRVTVAEASALQSYPRTFNWEPLVPVLRKGVDTGRRAPLSKTKAFLQIGNAVPPLLALRILETLTETRS